MQLADIDSIIIIVDDNINYIKLISKQKVMSVPQHTICTIYSITKLFAYRDSYSNILILMRNLVNRARVFTQYIQWVIRRYIDLKCFSTAQAIITKVYLNRLTKDNISIHIVLFTLYWTSYWKTFLILF